MRTGLKSSNSTSLRAAVGEPGKGLDESFIPIFCDDGTLILPNGKAKWLIRKRNSLWLTRVLLQSNIVRHSLAMRVVPTREARDLERWYEEWNGIVDALLLTDLALFNKQNRPLIRALFRKVFHMSMHNVDQVTSYFKEFTNCFWNTVSKSVTLEEFTLSSYNPFKILMRYKPFVEILNNGICSKSEATSIAHLVSTRQLVPGAHGVQVKALDKFYSTCSVEFQPTQVNLERASLGAAFVGRKISTLGRTKNLVALCHISLGTAGDVDFPKSKGGRGNAINHSIVEILDDYAVETRDVQLPFGFTVRDEIGVPRYCTWGRPENLRLKRVIPSTDPRWRIRAIWEDAPVYGFGGLRLDFNQETEGDKEAYEGYDEYLGIQIFYCALYVALNEGYMDLEGNFLKPVPARTSVVPEPGGKARVVTTTKWWVQVLEQPFGHLTKSLLSGHPSAEAGLKRADQAWLYLSLLHKVQPIPNAYVLSSDLEEATDAISPVVAEHMIRGFYNRIYGYIPKLIEIGICVGLRSTRSVVINYPRGSGRETQTFIKRRGVLMGEPVTKSILTLYSLVCEELAIRDYIHNSCFANLSHLGRELSMTIKLPETNVLTKFHIRKASEWTWALNCIATLPHHRIIRLSTRVDGDSHWRRVPKKEIDSLLENLMVDQNPHPFEKQCMLKGEYYSTDTYSGEVRVPWRAFAVGGDDHIAYGPELYLQLITSNHHAFGSKISLPKHGYSRVAVKFCEKILFLKGRNLNIEPYRINNSIEDYESSVWVDSIKVRLLSPLTKSMDCEDDRNTAIGKSGGISRTLSWLDPHFFSLDWCDVVLQRFTSRMYPYLPNPNGKNRRIFFQLMLPQEFGGLGLKPKSLRLSDVVSNCPRPTIAIIKMIISSYLGEDIVVEESDYRYVVRSLQRLCTANSARGIDKTETVNATEEFLRKRKSFSLAELREKFPDSKGARQLFASAKNAGYYPTDQAVELLTRPGIFTDALFGRHRASYATSTWRHRYQKLWAIAESILGHNYKFYNPTLTEAEVSILNETLPSEFLPCQFYNLYEPVADLSIFDGARSKGTNVSAKATSLALLFGASKKNTSMASSAKPLIEMFQQKLPDLNLRMDFHGNKVSKVRLEASLPSEDSSEDEDLSVLLRAPLAGEVINDNTVGGGNLG